mgnify:CR=1 FL=1
MRTFAFGLLESAASRHGPGTLNLSGMGQLFTIGTANYRALDVALKAARTCLGTCYRPEENFGR